MSLYTLPFNAPEPVDHDRVGGKCGSLITMTNAGMPVPTGFVITTDAYRALLEVDGLGTEIDTMMGLIDTSNVGVVDEISAAIRKLIVATPLPDDVQSALAQAYAEFCAPFGFDVPVAVRSSATAEDLPDASFAGQQDTILWVVGFDEVIAAVRKCWASLFNSRAITYRASNGIDIQRLAMAIAVQKMVNARTAGVAMTMDPSNGDRSKIVIDASWGLGELVVSGEVTPDNFVLDKVLLAPVKTIISDKHHELVPDKDARTVVHRDVEDDRRKAPSLSTEELVAVASLAKRAEKHYKCPQDVEWAIDADLEAPNNVVLLQARPETVWSQRATSAPTTAVPDAGIASIMNTLLNL